MKMKPIKFNLSMRGVKIATLESLRENFSAEILPIFQSGKLAKWLKSRDLLEQATAIEAIDKNGSELRQLKAICQTLGLDDDEEVLQSLLKDNADAMELEAQARRVDWVFYNEKVTSSENTDSKQADTSILQIEIKKSVTSSVVEAVVFGGLIPMGFRKLKQIIS